MVLKKGWTKSNDKRKEFLSNMGPSNMDKKKCSKKDNAEAHRELGQFCKWFWTRFIQLYYMYYKIRIKINNITTKSDYNIINNFGYRELTNKKEESEVDEYEG